VRRRATGVATRQQNQRSYLYEMRQARAAGVEKSHGRVIVLRSMSGGANENDDDDDDVLSDRSTMKRT